MPEDSPRATTTIEAAEVPTDAAALQCLPRQQHHSIAVVVAPGLGPLPLRHEAAEAAIPLGRTSSPLTTIGEALKQRRQQGTPAKELHLLAHGNSQGIQLADCWIDQAALLRHAADIAEWQISTLVLWCCQIGENQEFIALLEELLSLIHI